jgi:hypothetical protein
MSKKTIAKVYDRHATQAFIERILTDIGEERFSRMRLLPLKRLIRTYDTRHELPGRTALREAINAFRAARWPQANPRKLKW